MPILFAPFFGILLGFGLALLARRELERHEGSVSNTRVLHVAIALALFVYAPVLAYMLAFHGDWSLLYLMPAAKIPSAGGLVMVLLSASSVPFAVVVARRRLGIRLALFSLAVFAFGVLLAGKRLTISATYTQVHEHFGLGSSAAPPLALSVMVSVLAMGIALGLAVRTLRDRGWRTG